MEKPGTIFYAKCVLSTVAIMFLSMAAGEVLYDAGLFRGFLRRPEIWPAIVLETALAGMVLSGFGIYLLRKFLEIYPAQNEADFLKKSALIWLSAGLTLAIAYRFFYWPREWRLTALSAGLFFGWILPGTLTLAAWTHFSRRLFPKTSGDN